MKKSRYPVASFDPRMIETLLKAARGQTIKFRFPNIRSARAFQIRLHTLRSKMREEKDPRYDIICRGTTSLRNDGGAPFVKGQSNDGPKELWVLPRDYQWDTTFKQAGVEASEEATIIDDPLDHIEGPQSDE